MAYTYNYTPQIEALQKQIDNYGQFQYGKENAYQKALAAVTNPTAFSYDVENDPVYSAYRKQYLREGDRAMADTLAKLSAGTGGRPSSYAVMAAQQAGNYYNSQLTDVIPTLYENAYQRYLKGLDQQKNALNILAADREAALSQHQNNYGILLENLEHLQQLQAEQTTPTVAAPTYNLFQQQLEKVTSPNTLDRFNRVMDTVMGPGVKGSSTDRGMEEATKSFRDRMTKETEHWDAVMRHMHGSEKTYIAKQIEQSSMSDAEKAYLISLYGITENDLVYKN